MSLFHVIKVFITMRSANFTEEMTKKYIVRKLTLLWLARKLAVVRTRGEMSAAFVSENHFCVIAVTEGG